MKLNILRKVIREEVKAAVKEELQEVLTEAVRIASKPQKQENKVNISEPVKNSNLQEMLDLTKASMTNEDYKTIVNANSSMVTGLPNTASTMATQMNMNAGRQPGLDISNLDFVNKAKQVLDASQKVDASKNI
tara:strand:+ start:5143 stop:5541 length:399 start_codon:yes stop_codon:yes gene_type:complete